MQKRDAAHLSRLRDYYARHGSMPSYAGLSQIVGYRAKTSAVKLAARLRSAGFLQLAPGGKLAPTPQFLGLPLVATAVPAGHPQGFEESGAADRVSLDELLVDSPSSTVLVPIKGESMKDAGVLEGDIAVVDRSAPARDGDFVIAIVDGEFTFKQLFLNNGHCKLLPKNEAFDAIVPKQSLEVYGVVRGLVRKYKSTTTARKR